MNALTCKMCNSTYVSKMDGSYVCLRCGTKYSVEEAKKLMKETKPSDAATENEETSTSSNKLTNLYKLAKQAKNEGNCSNAQKYYEMIVMEEPDNWEPVFFSTYYKAMNCKIAEIRLAANSVSNNLYTVFRLIKSLSEEEQEQAVKTISKYALDIATMLYNGAVDHYNEIAASIKDNYTQEYINNCCAARDIMYNLGNLTEASFSDKKEIMRLATKSWDIGIDMHRKLLRFLADESGNQKTIINYNKKIRKYNEHHENLEKTFTREKINKLNFKIEQAKKEYDKNWKRFFWASIFIPIFSFVFCIFFGIHDTVGLYGVLMFSAALFLICVVIGFIYKKETAKEMYAQVYYLEQEKKKLLNDIEKMK